VYINGEISGYKIEYGITSFTYSMMIDGTDNNARVFTTTLPTPDATYKLKVAAMNSNGIGAYSNEIMQEIPRGK